MTDRDLENDLRAMLTGVEAGATPPDDLAERLTAVVTARPTAHRVDLRARRWLPPLLAAAAVIVVIAGGAVVISTTRADHESPATQNPSPTFTSSPTAPPSPPAPTPLTQSVVPPPASTVAPGFVAYTVWFRDAQHGYAIGDVPCAAAKNYCATLLRTDDGAATWSRMTLPTGLTPVINSGDGSCGTNGGVSGPCVDQVIFPDAQHGYLWSYNQFYTSTDGGQSWSHEIDRLEQPTATHVSDLAVAGNHMIRVGPHEDCSAGCRVHVEVASIGSNNWTDTTPAGSAPILGTRVLATPSAVYLLMNVADGRSVTYQSVDDGATWGAGSGDCGQYYESAVAPDGSLVETCSDTTGPTSVFVIPRTRNPGSPHPLPPGAHGTADAPAGAVFYTPWSSTKISCYFGVPIDLNSGVAEAFLTTDSGVTWTRQVDGQPWTVFGTDKGYRLRSDGKGLEVTTNAGDSYATIGF